MARRRFTIALNDFVSAARDNIINTKESVRSKMVADFNNRVVQEGLSLDVQLTFWEEMVRMESSSEFPTQETMKLNTEQVSTLKKQVRAKTYRDGLQRLRNDIASTKKTNEDLATWLTEQLQTVVDPDLRETMEKDVQTTNEDVQKDYENQVTNLVNRSKEDHSEDIIKGAMAVVDKRLALAITNRNKDAETFWKGQKTVVQQQWNTNKAEDAVDAAQLADFQHKSPLEVLQVWTDAVKNVPADGIPIRMTIGGSTHQFTDVRAFVTAQKTAYLNDPGSEGFFEKFRSMKQGQLESQITKMGTLSDAVLNNLQKEIDDLARNPELAKYDTQITNLKYDSNGLLKNAVTNNVNRLVIKFSTDYKFDSAANEIQRLADKYHVDAAPQMASLIVEFAKEKENIYNSILAQASQIQSDDPGLSWEQAVDKASKYLRGGINSPMEFVRTPLMTLITDAKTKGEQALMDKGQLKGRATQLPDKATRQQMTSQGWSYIGTSAGLTAARADSTKEVVSVAEPGGKINYYSRKKTVPGQPTTTDTSPSATGSTGSGSTSGTANPNTNTTPGQTSREKYEAQGWKYIHSQASVDAAKADPNKIVSLLEGNWFWKPKQASPTAPPATTPPATTPPTTTPPTTTPPGGTPTQSPKDKWTSQGWHYLGNTSTVNAYQQDPKKTVQKMDGMWFWRAK